MGRFEFRRREIELDFDGVKATVPGTGDFSEKLKDIGRRMTDFGKNNPDDAASMDFMLDIFDEILGEEVVDAIEESRELDAYDCFDMFAYMTDEVIKYHKERAERYKAKEPTPVPVPTSQPMAKAAVENRAARRARQRAERRTAK